jgi:hypothetical protein
LYHELFLLFFDNYVLTYPSLSFFFFPFFFFFHSKISYSQCIPSRFKKDIVCAAKEKETEHIVIEGLQKVVANIGGAQHVSRHDLEMIFSEVGASDGRISCEQMMKLL